MKAYKVVSCYDGRYFSSQMREDGYQEFLKTGILPWYFLEYKIGEKTVAANDSPETNKDLFVCQ